MKTKSPHINSIRTDLILNPDWIKQTFDFAGLEHETFIFERGLHFLSVHFEGNEDSIRHHSYNALFWKWWKAEYLVWELEFVRFVLDHQPRITNKLYVDEMTVLVHDSTTADGFNQFIKTFKYK